MQYLLCTSAVLHFEQQLALTYNSFAAPADALHVRVNPAFDSLSFPLKLLNQVLKPPLLLLLLLYPSLPPGGGG